MKKNILSQSCFKHLLTLIVALIVTVCPAMAVENTDTILRNRDVKPIPPSEMEYNVIGKDTVSIVIEERNYGRFNRGLRNYIFIPKHQWSIGLTMSVGSMNVDDVQFLGYIDNLNLKATVFSFKPYVAWAFRNNQTIGIRFNATRYKFDLGSLDVEFDSDINFSLKDVYFNSNTYAGSIFYRKYIGLDKGRRFGVFNEVELAFSSGKTTFQRNYNDQPKVTTTNATQWSLNFAPGVTVFMHERASFNLSVGFFSIYYKSEKQKTDGQIDGKRSSAGANFKFNLFSINLGLAVHI